MQILFLIRGSQVFTYPDMPYLDWKYCFDSSDDFSEEYKTTRISNKDRFTGAFKEIKKHLQTFLNKNPQQRDDSAAEVNENKFFRTLVLKEKTDDRIKSWKEFMINEELFEENDEFLDYDENLWLEGVFQYFISEDFNDRIVKEVYLEEDFLDSKWYKYYQGTQWYKKLFFESALDNDLVIPNEYVDIAEIIREER